MLSRAPVSWYAVLVFLALASPRTADPYIELETGSSVSSIAFSRGGTMLAAAVSGPPTIMVWDLTVPKKIRVFKKEFGQPGRMWFPDGNTVIVDYSVSRDGKRQMQLVKWNLPKGESDEERDVPKEIGVGVISPDATLLVTQPDKVAKVWRMDTFQEVAALEKADKGYAGFLFSADGRVLATVSGSHLVTVWDTKSWKEISRFQARTRFEQVAISAKGDLLVAEMYTEKFTTVWEFWDTATGKTVDRFSHVSGMFVKFSPDGRFLAAYHEGRLDLWDVATGKIAAKIPVQEMKDRTMNGFLFSDDCKCIATYYGGAGGVYLYAVPEIKADK